MFRTKTDVATDKATKQAKTATKEAKKVGKAAAARGEAVKGSVLSTTALALHSLSDSLTPKAAAAASAAKGGASHAKSAALDATADARAAAAERTEGAREAAKERAGVALEKATQARDSAVSGLDRGVDAAVPAMQHGVSGVSEKVDHARDLIVDDLLPKLQEMLSNAQASKDEVLAKPSGAAAAITGAPKKRGKKGGVLIAFGILAAIGAGVAYYLSQQKSTTEDDTDPWAGSSDSSTTNSSTTSKAKNGVAQTTAAGPVVAPTEADATDDAEVSAPGAADTNNDTVAGSASSKGDVAEVSEIKDGDQELPVMIDVDDVPGTDPDAQAGFGTDFSDTDEPGEGKHRA